MFAKKNIFANWIERLMCEDYRPINKWKKFNKYTMPLLEEIFDSIGQAKVFNTLDLQFRYH
jgi:hypothetical protein